MYLGFLVYVEISKKGLVDKLCDFWFLIFYNRVLEILSEMGNNVGEWF